MYVCIGTRHPSFFIPWRFWRGSECVLSGIMAGYYMYINILVYISVCIYICIYVCVCIRICLYIHINTHTYMCTQCHTYTYTHKYTHTHTHRWKAPPSQQWPTTYVSWTRVHATFSRAHVRLSTVSWDGWTRTYL